nr:pyruvate dehydrogenase, PDH=V8 proteinase digestion fragment 1 {EC 1.2.4.1} [swine, heart, Peptide Partial, 15 aa] [Sus scrofa]
IQEVRSKSDPIMLLK